MRNTLKKYLQVAETYLEALISAESQNDPRSLEVWTYLGAVEGRQ